MTPKEAALDLVTRFIDDVIRGNAGGIENYDGSDQYHEEIRKELIELNKKLLNQN